MWSDSKKVEMIGFLIDVRTANNEDEDGEKHLASADYTLEAIEAVLADQPDNSILRQFLQSPITATEPEVTP